LRCEAASRSRRAAFRSSAIAARFGIEEVIPIVVAVVPDAAEGAQRIIIGGIGWDWTAITASTNAVEADRPIGLRFDVVDDHRGRCIEKVSVRHENICALAHARAELARMRARERDGAVTLADENAERLERGSGNLGPS
jgi:hypothetical protein